MTLLFSMYFDILQHIHYMEHQEGINDRLVLFRVQARLSQTQIAQVIKVSQSSYARMEQGYKSITADGIVDLMDTYNINPLWLLKGKGEMFVSESSLSMSSPERKVLEQQILMLERNNEAFLETIALQKYKIQILEQKSQKDNK